MERKFYRFARFFIRGIFSFLYRPTILGKEHLLEQGSFVLAGNHTKWLDPFLLISSVSRPVHFLAKDSLFHGITGPFVRLMGCIPVNRKIHDKDALKKAKEELKKGCVIGIFPEGTINRTEQVVLPFKIGAVKMAQDENSFLVPFVITGKYRLFRKSIQIEFLPKHKILKNLDIENQLLMQEIGKRLESEHERNSFN